MVEGQDPEFVQKLLQSFYVDDVASGEDDEDGAYELYIKTKMRLAEGGFNARKFTSNAKTLIERIQENEELLSTTTTGTENEPPNAIIQVTEDDETCANSATGPQEVTPTAERY